MITLSYNSYKCADIYFINNFDIVLKMFKIRFYDKGEGCMGKKYLMFVDESGFVDSEGNFYMVGVIFEEDYCSTENQSDCSLRSVVDVNKVDISLISYNEKFKAGCILRTEIYNVLKDSKLSVLISRVKNEDNKIKDTFKETFKKLLKKYYYYTIDNNGNNAGIVMESSNEYKKIKKEQHIFNIYMDRDHIIPNINDCSSIINKFMVIDNSDEKYTYGINIADIIRNSIRYSYEKEKRCTKDYRYSDRMNEKIMELIREKIFTEEIAFDMSRQGLITKSKQIRDLEKRVIVLEEELLKKEINISSQSIEISELLDEIKVLQHQLDDIVLKRNNNVIFEILSDVDIRIKNMAK